MRKFYPPVFFDLKTGRPVLARVTRLAGVLCLFLLSLTAGAQIWSNPIDGPDPSAAPPFTAGQTVDPNITVSGLNNGPGVSFNTAGNRYNLKGWSPGFDPNDYFTWTLTPNAGYAIFFQNLVFRAQSSGTGPNTYQLRSSADNFVSVIASFNVPTSGSQSPVYTATLNAANLQNVTGPITFRMYAFGASGAGGTGSINEFSFNGSVSPVVTNSITTTGSYGPYCVNSDSIIRVTYTSVGTFTGPFTSQLSDADGDFSSPTNLGVGPSPMMVLLPGGLPPGNGYRIRVVNNSPDLAGSDNGVDIRIGALPDIHLGNDTAYCAGSPFNLMLDAGNPGSTYNWNNGAATTRTFNVHQTGTYTVSVTDALGCVGRDTLTVTQNALPAVHLGNDTAFCIGSTFNLSLDAGHPGAAYTWNNGAGNTRTFAATQPGNYTVAVTDARGCTGRDTLTVGTYALPTVHLGNDTAFCAAGTFSLALDAGNPGATYNWNNGAAHTRTFTATQTGTYSVTVTDVHGCQNRDSLSVTEYALPLLALGNDTGYCAGSQFSLLLDAGNPGATYSWNGGGLTARIFAVSQAGTYSVLVTDAHGCTASDEVLVTAYDLPTVDIEDNTFYCTGSNFNLLLDAGNPGATYNWNNGAANTQTFAATRFGLYRVTVTDARGCRNSDSMRIEEKPLPVIHLGNDTAYCAGSGFSLVLHAGNPGASYSWNGGAANTPDFTVTQAGTYTLNVTDVYGCSNNGSITVTQLAAPQVNLGADVNTQQTSYTINAGAGFAGYLWQPGGQTSPQITVNQNGHYSVTVRNAAGCTASDTITVTFVPNTASIAEPAAALSLQVYPNPVSEKLNLKLDYQGALRVDLVSMQGQVLKSYPTGNYEAGQVVEIDLTPFPAGVYGLRLSGTGWLVGRTIVIQR